MNFIANDWKSILPAGWSDRSMITLVGTTGASGVAANIVVTRQEIDLRTSIEDFAESQKQMMMQEIEAVEILDERPTTVNGAPAFQRLQRFVANDFRVQQAQTFILGANSVFVVTGTAALEDFNAVAGAIREFTENFQLTNR